MSFVRRASLLDVVYWTMSYTGNGKHRSTLNAIYAKFKMVSGSECLNDFTSKNCIPGYHIIFIYKIASIAMC